jgi:hypothetical protein
METIIVFAGVLAVLTVALVQLVKKTTTIPENLMPVVSLVIGLLVGVIALFVPEITSDLSVGGHILAGGISGLSASGLYDLATKTTKTKNYG